MNKTEADILIALKQKSYTNQRDLSEKTGYSLGAINKTLKKLSAEGFLTEDHDLTDKANDLIADNSPLSAVILAAGSGMRMVPINTVTSKGLLMVNGEPIIEHTIRQLHEAGIRDISVVVGFLKEKYEYLIDDYNVRLIVNSAYSSKNNLHSLALASRKLSRSYIVPCDVYCEENPFRAYEISSWYMMKEKADVKSDWRISRSLRLEKVKGSAEGNTMVGIAYVNGAFAEKLSEKLIKFDSNEKYDNEFWETAMRASDFYEIEAQIVTEDKVYEINTYEQLRDLDGHSEHLDSEPITIAAEVFKTTKDEIRNIRALKKGMTNRSFMFEYNGKRYIMRVPGEGTDKLINRKQEAEVYRTIAGKGLCDDVVYINPDNGFKITEYIENVRSADGYDEADIRLCMDKLRTFHNMKLKVDHEFDIFGQIEFYEELWDGAPSIYRDYESVKKNVLSLKPFIDAHCGEKVLTHIDAVPDNFLIYKDADGNDQVQLTDWEYSGMQDPHADLAMFSIYCYYEKEQVDHLIDIYFEGACDKDTRIKIYCYVAACGLLWSNWCEYKRNLGVEFGEYSLRQYRYAKEFYRYAKELMEEV